MVNDLAVTACATAITLGGIITVRWLLARAEANQWGAASDAVADDAAAKAFSSPVRPSATRAASSALKLPFLQINFLFLRL
jgi:hypothetical protein